MLTRGVLVAFVNTVRRLGALSSVWPSCSSKLPPLSQARHPSSHLTLPFAHLYSTRTFCSSLPTLPTPATTMAETMEGVVTTAEEPKPENVEQKTVAGKTVPL
jgi:hypothetical protein